MEQDGRRRILYVQTHGVDMPERSATPFYLAAAAAAMDVDVGIYFTMNGPTLLKRDVPEQLVVPKKGGGGAPLRYFIDQALELGVRLYVCQPSLDLHGLRLEDLIEGVEMIGGAAFNAMALEADAVIAF
ncbi:MAG: DsrE family protein [Armatimonadota bacterium]|nr:DsrE family protein [Armatimonadota bacterium]MDR5675910.1 DsrE family protein [Armatimonadota bacterium]MDR5688897.1 DsrE family protein [Armatimonadota bacterium]MDR7387368.1 DsrE family protein [Armatimonadota bacterium]MDR7390009.1 DsrE family protein [Armatimonadota bacterium]